jgi:hypothetical protein
MKRLMLVLVVAACAPDPDYPVIAGGSGVRPGSQSTAVTIGRVCVVTDLLSLGTCASTGASGITVSLGSSTVTTAADGTFRITTPNTVNPMITVTGPGLVSSAQLLGGTSLGIVNSIPALSSTLFEQMLAANGIGLLPGAGSIVATVLRRGVPVSGVTASSIPTSVSGPLFDGSTPTAFTINATGARGIVWFPGVPIGPVNLRFSDLSTAGETTVAGVQVVNGGITFLDSVVLP